MRSRTTVDLSKLIIPGLFVCFLLSGTAALIYEVVWMRMLTQVFGSAAYAVATVLAGFMAGLALGSYCFGRLVDRGGNYLRQYGLLELGIGAYGLLAPWIFKLAGWVYVPLFWLNDSQPQLFSLLLFLLAFTLLLVPTFLMGATLPVLSRFLVTGLSQVGKKVGDLYATNTLGAVLGCGLAGYLLLPWLGIRGTLWTAAALNLAVAAAILLADRARRKREIVAGRSAPATEKLPVTRLGLLVLAAIGLSGAAAMIYENAWSHALTLVIGGSVYSFTTMLLSFLIGLALGGYLYARLWGESEVHVTTFGIVQLGVGAAGLATIALFEKLPLLFLRLHQGFGDEFAFFLGIQVVISVLMMLPATVLFGMSFPMVVRIFTQSLYHVGSSVGAVYAVNTVGAIIGAFSGGFILLPLIGIQRAIVFGAFLNLIVGWLLVVMDPRPGRGARVVAGGLASALLLLLALWTPSWDRHILTSGVTVYYDRYQDLPTDSLRLEEMRRDKILYYREGITATISVHQSRPDYLYLKTNGKVDGSYGDALTMLMTGYLPLFLHPNAERVGIIGLGTAMTAKAVAAFPVKTIEVLEIEPAMVEAARFFKEKNGGILDDARVRVIASDGRNYVLATPKLFDIIISEPSNPWIAGIASLYTREFYAGAKKKLRPDGIFAQWFHNYSMSPDDFRMVFRTFAESFPHVSVWNMKESDFLLVGTLKEHSFDYRSAARIYASNKILREDFAGLGLDDAYTVLGFYRMGKKEVQAFTAGAEVNTDDNLRLEFYAPRSLGKTTPELNRSLMEPFVVAPPWKIDAPSIADGDRHYFVAQALRASSRYERALEEIERALAADPRNPAYHLLRAQILAAQEELDEALKSALEALRGGPQYVSKVLTLAEDFYTRQAEVIYRKLLAAGTADIRVFLGLGNIALHRKETARAEKLLKRAAALEPGHRLVLLALGRLELAKGNHAAARELLEQAKALGTDSSVLYSALGEAYTRLGEWQRAADVYQAALRHQRKHTQWRFALARALLELGRTDEAEEKYREILALDPNFTPAWQGLKRLGERY
ncbi:MAG TPA: fused MFS/spermidine synthase [Candidatus Acidoferrales bacterium]|nr:fused MFS/spermidine synthase [Candidatus Acidoferrales bacterium]